MKEEPYTTLEYLPHWGLSRETFQKYGVKTRIDETGKPVSVVFPWGGTANQIRKLDQKDFKWEGAVADAGLFGEHLFPPGSARAVTVTEGAKDAMAAYEMLGSKYPAVSVKNAQGAKQDCVKRRDYLNSFEKIYLCFDADAPGQKAVREVAPLFDFNKVYHVRMGNGCKDPHDYKSQGKDQEFKNLWYGSKRFLPEGIVSSYSEVDSILDASRNKIGEKIPFPTLDEKLGGLRTGASYLITALEGVGKTELIRTLEYSLLKTTDHNIGIIHLEEPKDRLIKGIAGYELKAPAHLPESAVSLEEVKKAYRVATARDDRVHIYSHFGSDDPYVILDTIRFLVSGAGCKFVFLDHITMVVSGLFEEDERKALDMISTRLAMMVEELDFCLVFVSHINDFGQTRGSRYISKIAHSWIELSRDVTHESEYMRGIMNVLIKKNRFKGQTGPGGKLFLSPETHMLHEINPDEVPA